MIESLRARLTIWYVGVLASVLISVCILIYVLLGRALFDRLDQNLRAVTSIAATSLSHDLAEGQSVEDAARSTVAELFSDQATFAIYDGQGRLLAEEGRDEELTITLPPIDSIPREGALLYNVAEDDGDDRYRLAVRRARVGPTGTEFIVLASTDLEQTDDELASLRKILISVVPAALVMAAIVGWLMARQSLSPVMVMAERARRIGVENLGGRLPVVNPRDELGRLAATFNELLSRLAGSFGQQRQFMADASHELRTPVATARTAAAVALQQPHRSEAEYRDTLQIIEQQTARLARVVDDMFVLARADAGNYPVRRNLLYLDELIEEVARSARVLASRRQVHIEVSVAAGSLFTGDEDLLRRLTVNLIDNAVKHAPPASVVRVRQQRTATGYIIEVSDAGPGIPAEVVPHVFERFYRGDPARARAEADGGGAGLGLAIAQWIAQEHQGSITITSAEPGSTTFAVDLPYEIAAET